MPKYDYTVASFAAVRASLAEDEHALNYIFDNAPDPRRLYAEVAEWCSSKVLSDFSYDRAGALRVLDRDAQTLLAA